MLRGRVRSAEGLKVAEVKLQAVRTAPRQVSTERRYVWETGLWAEAWETPRAGTVQPWGAGWFPSHPNLLNTSWAQA